MDGFGGLCHAPYVRLRASLHGSRAMLKSGGYTPRDSSVKYHTHIYKAGLFAKLILKENI